MLVITIGDEENKKGVREMSEILYGKENFKNPSLILKRNNNL